MVCLQPHSTWKLYSLYGKQVVISSDACVCITRVLFRFKRNDMLMLYYKYSTLYDILEQTYTHFSAVKPGAKALKAPCFNSRL